MDIDIQRQQLKTDILQRIREMKRLCLASELVGKETLIALADHGETLDDLDSHISSVNSKLVTTKQNLKQLKRFQQRLSDFFRGSVRCLSQQNILSKLICISTTSSLKLNHSIRKMFEHQPSIIRSTNFDIDDEGIAELQNLITNRLKNLAIGINNELVRQNRVIDDIQQHINHSNDSMGQLNIDIQKTV